MRYDFARSSHAHYCKLPRLPPLNQLKVILVLRISISRCAGPKREKWSAIAMLNVLVILLSILVFGYGTVAKAADEGRSATYVGKVILEITVFFPKEFDQFDEKFKREMIEAMKKTGAQECKNGLRMPMKPLIGAWLIAGKQSIMTDTNGEFALSSLPPNTTEIPIYQQLSDHVPLAQFPVKRLSRKGEKVQPFIISIRTPFGECHAGKVDHTN